MNLHIECMLNDTQSSVWHSKDNGKGSSHDYNRQVDLREEEPKLYATLASVFITATLVSRSRLSLPAIF